MFPRSAIPWILGVVLGAVGCAGTRDVASDPVPRAPGRDFPVLAAPAEPTGEDPFPEDEPEGVLTLRDAAAATLLGHPDLLATSRAIRVREATAIQAGLAPNPVAGVEVENFAGSGDLSGFGGSETTLALSQLIELGGKRGDRRVVAGWERNLAAWDHEARRLDVLAGTARRFVSVLAAQEQVRILEELAAVADTTADTAARRVRAGGASPVEATRARVDRASRRLAVETARRELDIARRELAAQWGSEEPRFTRAEGDLAAVTAPVALGRLLPLAESNPDLARWESERALREAERASAGSAGVPDLTLLGGFRYLAEGPDHSFVAGVEIPLPFSDRNQGAVRVAEHRLAGTVEDERAARLAVRTAIAVTHERWVAAHREIEVLRDEILPEARFAQATVEDAYRRGRFAFTDVLETRRTLFELETRYTRALEIHHHARVELERLLGAPIPGEEN
jgi:cobalt-zinc-cadmium efflux system outer membrane protein